MLNKIIIVGVASTIAGVTAWIVDAKFTSLEKEVVVAKAQAMPRPAIVRPTVPGIEIQLKDNLISMRNKEMPLATLLTAVAKETGATLTIRGELGLTPAQTYESEKIYSLLPRIAQPHGLMLRFEKSKLVAITAIAATPKPKAQPKPKKGLL